MQKLAYVKTDSSIQWVAGRWCPTDAPIMLTEREAEYEIARGVIVLAPSEAPVAEVEETAPVPFAEAAVETDPAVQ